MLLLQRFALFFFLTASLAGPTLGQPAEPPPDSLRAEALIQEARALYGAGDHPAALEKASQAFELFQKRYGDEHSTTARARMFVAREYRNLGREADALHLFEVSLLFFESRSDTFRIVVSHLNMGLCLRDLFRNAEAHRHFQTGIELLRPDSARQAVIIADLYVGVGSVYNAERQYAAAIPVLENAREVYTLLRRTDACGMAKYHLGGAWLGLHDYFRAREYYLGALADLKDKLRPGHPYFADLYVKIGVCCQKTGASELGLQHLLEAKASYLQAGSETLDYLQFLKYLGEFYLEEGNSAAAIQQLEECLRGKEKQFGPQSLHLLGALQALADAWLLAAAPGRAEMYSRRALQLLALAADSDRPAASPFYRQLAEANEQLGNWPAALAFCDSAFAAAGLSCAQAGRMQPRDQARALCQRRATAFRLQYQQTGDTTALFHAESCFAQAAALLDQEIETISSGGARHSFYDRAHRLFEQWLDCRLEGYARTADRQHALAAFEIASRSKAFLLRKAILQSGALQFAGLPDSALLLERQLRVQIANVEAQLDTAQLSGRALTGDGQLAASQVLADLRNRYDALLIRIEQQFPAYFHLQHPERPENAWAACRRALAPGQALLLYSQTDRGFCAFVLRQD
ncbi:MAG: tetratricopeptide repeat protein, partial [Saprospiraceae bacterium]|nr:tetratricopeptide repeat protein [Saprospiraceae bacterium]